MGVGLQAVVLSSLPGTYVRNTPSSEWIGPSANPFGVINSGFYDYRETFDLSGLDPSSVVIHGRLASDNDSKVVLNGVDTGVARTQPVVTSPNDFDILLGFSLSRGFVDGLNTIDVIVHNDYSATGFQLDVSGVANPRAVTAPVVTSAIQNPGSTDVLGTYQGNPYTTYLISLNATTGGLPLASASATGSTSITTNASGFATFFASLPTSVTAGQLVFARATNPKGSVSPESAPRTVTASKIIPPPPPVVVPAPGPVVTRLQRIGEYRQPTRLRLTFNEALNPARAQNIANYHLVDEGPDGRLGTRNGRVLAIQSASYDAGTDSVILALSQRINLHHRYEVIATGEGPQGITDVEGRALNARVDGSSGGPYRAIVQGFWLSAR